MPELMNITKTQIFSMRHITTYFSLGTLESTSALCLETILTSEVINKNHKNAKKHGIK